MEDITGKCHCGYIEYQAQGPIIKCSYCDCNGCKKATGTFKAPFITVKRNNFSIISGNISKFKSESKERCDGYGEWYFCTKCGTQLYWKSFEGDQLDIFAGTLDNTNLFKIVEAQ